MQVPKLEVPLTSSAIKEQKNGYGDGDVFATAALVQQSSSESPSLLKQTSSVS